MTLSHVIFLASTRLSQGCVCWPDGNRALRDAMDIINADGRVGEVLPRDRGCVALLLGTLSVDGLA